MALLATFLVGVLAASQLMLAAAAGVLVVMLLVSRAPLHAFAHAKLSDQELRDAVLLAAAAILVLPILPDHPIDPWNVVNPRMVWKLTVLIMLVDAVGYVAQRLVGARAGLPDLGIVRRIRLEHGRGRHHGQARTGGTRGVVIRGRRRRAVADRDGGAARHGAGHQRCHLVGPTALGADRHGHRHGPVRSD